MYNKLLTVTVGYVTYNIMSKATKNNWGMIVMSDQFNNKNQVSNKTCKLSRLTRLANLWYYLYERPLLLTMIVVITIVIFQILVKSWLYPNGLFVKDVIEGVDNPRDILPFWMWTYYC